MHNNRSQKSGIPESGHSEPLHDFMLHENLANLVRKKIPERTVSAKGFGAYGVFKVTGDITKYTRAKLFSNVENTCKTFVRFSMETSESGEPDSRRDVRGFAIKFYMEDGNWDLVGHNAPVYFIRDAKKFPDLMRSQQRHPKTNIRSEAAMWDFWSQNPESLHQVLMMFSERGIPNGYRHMHGYGANTYSFIDSEDNRVWVKFHLKTEQGIENLTPHEQNHLAVVNPDYAQRDLYDAVENGDFPKWKLFIQVMTENEAKDFRWNPFDVTKVWSQKEFSLIEVGILELNEIPEDYFSHVEQAVFSPSNLVDGISLSPDSILQARLFAYPDAQRYRVGVHSDHLEVNKSLSGIRSERILSDKNFQDVLVSSENDDDHYTQPGFFYSHALDEDGREMLVDNLISSMQKIDGPRKNEIINRQLCHFFRANIELGLKIAGGLHIKIDANMMGHVN